jgi:hypothetical protein
VFKWLINYFTSPKEEPTKEETLDELALLIKKNSIKIKEEIKPTTPEARKPEIKKERTMATDYYEQLKTIWLVVVDTTGLSKTTRDESDDGFVNDARKLGPLGIKTFAFVNAPDINTAKGLLWRTLGARNAATRRFMAEIARATRVTNFTQIFPLLTKMGMVWNYLGGTNEYLPGQQSALARQSELAGKDAYGNDSAREYQPAAPVVPDDVETRVSKNDLSGLSAEDRKVLQSNQQTMPNMPMMNGNMNPQQMMAMMMQMMQMMSGQQPMQAPPATQLTPARSISELSAEDAALVESTITPISPNVEDPELERQIEDMRARKGQGMAVGNIESDDVDPEELAKMAKMTETISPKTPDEVSENRRKRRSNA